MSLDCTFLSADTFGLSESSRRALAGRPNPTGFDGLIVPGSLDDIPEPPDQFDADSRAELRDALLNGLEPFKPHVAVVDAIRALGEPGTTIVMAGQQPGFLGGPLLDLHKAAHAVKLARALTEKWGKPVVAGFWNHSDDHDIAEVHHLWIQNPQQDLRKVGLAGVSSSRVPLYKFTFDEEQHRLGAVRELLRQNLIEGGPDNDAIDLFLPRDGETFGAAFGRTMLDLLGAQGLIVFEPHMIRSRLSRALAGALGTPWQSSLRKRADEMKASELDVPIDPESAALVFRMRGSDKHALRWSAGTTELAFDDEPGSRTQAELAAEVLDAPDEFIAGALVRPVLQDVVLPTAAYIGGWGELAYHLQITELRRTIGAPAPPFVPRVSATLITPKSRHALTQLETTLAEVLAAAGKYGETSKTVESPPVVAELTAIGERAALELTALRAAMKTLDPGLASQTKRLADQVRSLVDRLGQKATRAYSTQSGRGRRHLRRLNHGLMPRGGPQERARGALEFVARFGTEWIAEWVDLIDPIPTEHVVLDIIEEHEE